MERTRFLKTGAEAVAAALRLARCATGREFVLRCGYHGWHDWSQPAGSEGIPAATFALSEELPFGDSERARSRIRLHADRLAAVIIEPIIEQEPPGEWLTTLREETRRSGALLIVDEIKTGFRVALGGAAERYRIDPDLVVLGKALANGFPLAAVGGRREVMEAARRTWISSTLASEMVALAAATATVEVMVREQVPRQLQVRGRRLQEGLEELTERHPALIQAVAGVPEMCYLQFSDETIGALVARSAAGLGLLWKRGAYNFVSLAHDDAAVDRAVELLDAACDEVTRAAG
jgi:glutamate-1-semialdehyde 2,1-aminomutase